MDSQGFGRGSLNFGEGRLETAANQAIEFARSCSERESPPEADLLLSLIAEASAALTGEADRFRPRSSSGLPGGLVRVSSARAIVVPDLHARPRLILDLLRSRLPGGASVAEALASGELSVICLGDILHAEGQEAATRWKRATNRLVQSRGFEGLRGSELEAEMTLSLSALLEVAYLQARFPGGFSCLKGNHDNMGNRSTDGDSPFGKYSHEGLIGSEWFKMQYGEKALEFVRGYELLLPLVAAGRGFCASHAEPAFAVRPEDLLEYRSHPELVRALIWTRDGQADEDAVATSLAALLGPQEAGSRRYWIAGHRALSASWQLREKDGFLQIHCPQRNQVLLIEGGEPPASPELLLCAVDPDMGLVDRVPVLRRS